MVWHIKFSAIHKLIIETRCIGRSTRNFFWTSIEFCQLNTIFYRSCLEFFKEILLPIQSNIIFRPWYTDVNYAMLFENICIICNISENTAKDNKRYLYSQPLSNFKTTLTIVHLYCWLLLFAVFVVNGYHDTANITWSIIIEIQIAFQIFFSLVYMIIDSRFKSVTTSIHIHTHTHAHTRARARISQENYILYSSVRKIW